MKIAILVSEFPPHAVGGTENQSLGLATRLARRNDVTVLTRKLPDTPSSETRDGFSIRRFRYADLPVVGLLSHSLFSLKEILRTRKDIDVLQCMMIRPNGFVGALAKKLFGLRYVVWLRSEYRFFGRGRGFDALTARFALRNADMILTQTESIRDEVLEDYPGKDVRVVNNGIELEGKRYSGKDIVLIGNLTKRKGAQYLVMALHDLKSRGIAARARIIGDGPEREYLEGISHGLDVEFVGRVPHDEIRGFIKNARVLVLPSVTGIGEGFPNVILEAMSMGVPVIASRIAGIPDVVQEGKTGFLTEPGNHAQIAEALREMLENDSLHESMSRQSFKEAGKYSWDIIIKRLEGIYSEYVK